VLQPRGGSGTLPASAGETPALHYGLQQPPGVKPASIASCRVLNFAVQFLHDA
jgi:hypothetical protein